MSSAALVLGFSLPNGTRCMTINSTKTRGKKTRILSVATAEPEYTRTTDELLPLVELWLLNEPERFREKVKRLFRYAGVDRRYSIFQPEEVFSGQSFADRNRIYIERMLPLAEQALRSSLDKAGLTPQELDVLVTTSCTGITIPGLDAMLINRVGLRQDILRLPVFQMGCAGGVAGTIYAKHMLESSESGSAAVLSLESPVTTLQPNDHSMANMVSAAIFGDGVACAVVSKRRDLGSGPVIADAGMYHFPQAEHLMGFELVDKGLKMVLDPTVPEHIDQHFKALTGPFLSRNGLSLKDIHQFIFHPGGRKILQRVEELLTPLGKNVQASKDVLREHGNMSSATVLYVLDRVLKSKHSAEEYGLMLSFGPGFTAQRILLRWEEE